jgi:hypothetical protein
MNNKFVFALAIVLASLSIAEVVHYRDGQGVRVGHIARAFTIPFLIIVMFLARSTRSRPK